jgi:sugar O-acyltransferase (sialic acid O-acetyltransferase NeuD family)
MDSSTFLVNIPLLNPNEPEAKVVSLAVEEKQFVKQGDLLCTLETTKSTAEVIAERDGFIIGLQFSEGEIAQAGARLCYLAENENWQPETVRVDDEPGIDSGTVEGIKTEIPAGLRISQPALSLAKANNLDLNELPVGPLVTEKLVREIVYKSVKLEVQDYEFNTAEIIVYGGGGHGKSVIDLIQTLGIYHIHGVVDDGLKPGTSIMSIPVLGGSLILPDLHKQGIRQAVNAVGGIGDISSRIKVFQLLAAHGFVCPTIIHPSAVIENSSKISPGIQVFPQAYVGSEVSIGFGVIVNTGAIISHDCSLEDYTNISPGAVLAGGVTIGRGSLIGMGVTVNLGVKIGDNCRIGNSATIKSDLDEGSLIRAGSIWPD